MQVLELSQVEKVVREAASTALKGSARVQGVSSSATSDSEGQEALHITIVLSGGNIDEISGDKALDTLVSIESALRAAKEERFPIIDFATEEELKAGVDTES